MDTLVLPPFVATAIVEHAKRRRNAAGYLVGSRSGNQITITDHIPCTHESTTELRTRAYMDELAERIAVKKFYTPSISLVGWYAAGAPEKGRERAFDVWCEAPGASFSRIRDENQAVMLVARMPSASLSAVTWQAWITSNSNEGEGSRCRQDMRLHVSVEAQTGSMNAMLADIVSKALCDGGVPYAWSGVTNLDRVALSAGKESAPRKDNDTRPVEAALVSVQNKLHQAISHAQAILGTGNKSNKEHIAQSSAIAENYDIIVAEKNHQVSRDDFITENYKDALMIKYLASLLRRHVSDIERHARFEAKEKTTQGHGQGHGHGRGRGRGGAPHGRGASFR